MAINLLVIKSMRIQVFSNDRLQKGREEIAGSFQDFVIDDARESKLNLML